MRRAGWAALALGALVVAERRARASLGQRSRVLVTEAGLIEVELTGSGSPVLVLHGAAGGFDQGTWLAHALDLRDHRVISVSRPAYLRTPHVETLDDEIRLYAAALDELGVDRLPVIGGSGGGMAAAALAAGRPDRVSRLVMVSAVSGPVIEEGAAIAPYVARMMIDVNIALASAARRRSQLTLLAELAATVVAPEQRLRGLRRDITLSRDYALSRVSVPALVVHGTADSAVAFAHAERTVAACDTGELVVIEGGGHLCCMTHAEVGERVRRFLAA